MNYQEAYKQFNALFENELSVEEAAQFLVELYERGESFEEIAAAAKVMREHSVKLDIPEQLKEEIFKKSFGAIMKYMGGIPVDRSKSNNK